MMTGRIRISLHPVCVSSITLAPSRLILYCMLLVGSRSGGLKTRRPIRVARLDRLENSILFNLMFSRFFSHLTAPAFYETVKSLHLTTWRLALPDHASLGPPGNAEWPDCKLEQARAVVSFLNDHVSEGPSCRIRLQIGKAAKQIRRSRWQIYADPT
jgi:hypothetical protein